MQVVPLNYYNYKDPDNSIFVSMFQDNSPYISVKLILLDNCFVRQRRQQIRCWSKGHKYFEKFNLIVNSSTLKQATTTQSTKQNVQTLVDLPVVNGYNQIIAIFITPFIVIGSVFLNHWRF